MKKNGIIHQSKSIYTQFRKSKNIYVHIVRKGLLGCFLTIIALFVGMLGYHIFESMPWIDAFLNASMILSGMGPAANMTTFGGKLFAGLYALFSGLAFIAIIAITLSPVVHAFFQKIHIESHRALKDD